MFESNAATIVAPVAVGFFASCLGYLFCRPEVSMEIQLVNEVSMARKNYYKEVDKILEEREAITLELKSINQRITRSAVTSSAVQVHQESAEQVSSEEQYSNPSRFFSGASKKILFAEKENVQRQELSDQLHQLMWSYPRLDATQRNDLNYLIMAQKDLIEHHSKVLAIKDFLFDEVHKTH